MTAVSPGSPGTPVGGGLTEPALLPLRRAITEAGQDEQPARQVVQLMITGNHPVINYTVQHAVGGGTNVAAAAGPVEMAGANGTAIGNQTASGTGGQSVQAAGDAVTAGRDVAVPAAGEQPVKEGWWARLRKRGVVVAFAAIIGALAGVAGVVVAIMVAAGWKPGLWRVT